MASTLKDCVICGEDHPRCSRHNASGSACMRHPRDEEALCRVHGGEAPQIKAAGAERRALKAAQADAKALLGYDLSGTVADPVAVLDSMVATEIAIMQALASQLNALNSVSYKSTIGTEQTRAVAVMYERSRDRVVRYTEVLLKHKPDGEAAATVNLLTSLADRLAGVVDE